MILQGQMAWTLNAEPDWEPCTSLKESRGCCTVSSLNVKESKFEIVTTVGQTSLNSDCSPSWEFAEGEKRGCILFPVKISLTKKKRPYVYKELLAGKLMKETSRHFFLESIFIEQ